MAESAYHSDSSRRNSDGHSSSSGYGSLRSTHPWSVRDSHENIFQEMPYIVVRGTLGMSNTKIYGLSSHEAQRLNAQLRPGPVNPDKDEITFYNSAVFVMNQLEYFFGYTVIGCACQGQEGQPIWTMSKGAY